MDFQDLLQDAEQMTAQIDKENVGMPRLQRTINQMLETNKLKLAKSTNYLASLQMSESNKESKSPIASCQTKLIILFISGDKFSAFSIDDLNKIFFKYRFIKSFIIYIIKYKNNSIYDLKNF